MFKRLYTFDDMTEFEIGYPTLREAMDALHDEENGRHMFSDVIAVLKDGQYDRIAMRLSDQQHWMVRVDYIGYL